MATNSPQDSPAFRAIPASRNLVTVASELNKATKKLSTIIDEIEGGLNQINLGVSGFVPLSSSEDDTTSEALGYTKYGGRWALVIRETKCAPDGELISEEDTCLRDASRDTRAWAAAKFQELFEELTTQALQLTRKIAKNLDNAETLAKGLAESANSTDGKAASK